MADYLGREESVASVALRRGVTDRWDMLVYGYLFGREAGAEWKLHVFVAWFLGENLGFYNRR